ncbi:GntR family transcriptional regulator [Kribbella sp. NBC_01505]|uniref:GntR family transcriptional regulator n=1 Tax=Kribbella sp. NBC_01505 TaxID=2903580 RepID=UPI0038638A71
MTTISAGPGAEPAGVRHVKRPQPLRESVYEALTEMIIDGTLERGRHLVEVELAGLLGVSRQPVREALQRLNNEGWVDLRPGFGAMVHVPAEDEVDQLLAARAALESESARLAARHATKEDLAKLKELCKVGTAFHESGDTDGAVRTNGELHAFITQMSGNRFLIDFAAQVDRRVRWYYTPLAPVRGAASWREHSRLVKAISDGDEDKAAQTMREHTEHTRKAYHDLRAAEGPAEPTPEPEPRRRRRTL